jgi:hypothetical protein
MHASADRTFQIVEVDDCYVCVGISANGPPLNVDRKAEILIQIEVFQSRKGSIVL